MSEPQDRPPKTGILLLLIILSLIPLYGVFEIWQAIK